MTIGRVLSLLALAFALTVGLSACGSGSADQDRAGSDARGEQFPDVVKVEVTGSGGSRDFAVTMTSPYDSEDRYADGMRVRSADGQTVYGSFELTHDHASEQPFTRSITDVEIPDGIDTVVVEGRDQVSGWGGATKTVTLG